MKIQCRSSEIRSRSTSSATTFIPLEVLTSRYSYSSYFSILYLLDNRLRVPLFNAQDADPSVMFYSLKLGR